MKIAIAKFSVPACLLFEPLPSKALKLLIYLIQVSDYGGACRPGYDAMRKAMRDHDRDNGSNHTVRNALQTLKKKGWIFTMKRTNSKMGIWLQIPHRFKSETKHENLISVVQ